MQRSLAARRSGGPRLIDRDGRDLGHLDAGPLAMPLLVRYLKERQAK